MPADDEGASARGGPATGECAARREEVLAVLFADLIGGEGLFSALGDTWAVDVITRAHEILRSVVGAHQGRVVKTVAAEVMCAFPNPARAAMASGDMHLNMREAAQGETGAGRDRVGLREVRLRVGIHVGPVLAEGGDLFGDTVNVAARLMGLAKADQTLCSRQVVDGLPSEMRSSTRFFDTVAPRGKTETLEVHEVLWEVDGLTMAAPVIPLEETGVRHSELQLRYQGQLHVVSAQRPFFSLGRAAGNDLVHGGDYASRRHASIELRRGRFVLTDESANGTFVVPEGGAPVVVRRDAHRLDGRGRIFLGELPDTEGAVPVEYICR